MVKLNDEIIGGLVSALSRGESLEKAMMTFYNAGYEKEEIEDSAKDVYNKIGSQKMGVKGSLQETLDEIATKAGVPKKEKPKEEQDKKEGSILNDKLELQPIPEKKDVEEEIKKENANVKQNVSAYIPDSFEESQYRSDKDITNKIEEAIKGLRPVNIPSKIEIVHKNEESKSPTTIVQHVSSYDDSAKSPSKAMTYVLIFILILLLGALVGVFLFKDDLIKLFNELGLG